MRVLVNGEPCELNEGATIAELLAARQMAGRQVAVEVNLEVVPRSQHEQHVLCEGDQLEVVSLVGGG